MAKIKDTLCFDLPDFEDFIDHEATYEGSCDDPAGLAWAEAQLAYWD
jgi:hypothetical protein